MKCGVGWVCLARSVVFLTRCFSYWQPLVNFFVFVNSWQWCLLYIVNCVDRCKYFALFNACLIFQGRFFQLSWILIVWWWLYVNLRKSVFKVFHVVSFYDKGISVACELSWINFFLFITAANMKVGPMWQPPEMKKRAKKTNVGLCIF